MPKIGNELLWLHFEYSIVLIFNWYQIRSMHCEPYACHIYIRITLYRWIEIAYTDFRHGCRRERKWGYSSIEIVTAAERASERSFASYPWNDDDASVSVSVQAKATASDLLAVFARAFSLLHMSLFAMLSVVSVPLTWFKSNCIVALFIWHRKPRETDAR